MIEYVHILVVSPASQHPSPNWSLLGATTVRASCGKYIFKLDTNDFSAASSIRRTHLQILTSCSGLELMQLKI